jgi:hypothetical protein
MINIECKLPNMAIGKQFAIKHDNTNWISKSVIAAVIVCQFIISYVLQMW